jgi:hypothetical protein
VVSETTGAISGFREREQALIIRTTEAMTMIG